MVIKYHFSAEVIAPFPLLHSVFLKYGSGLVDLTALEAPDAMYAIFLVELAYQLKRLLY